MSSWTPHDYEMDYLLAEMEDHFYNKCIECKNTCNIEYGFLSARRYYNCLYFGLYEPKEEQV